MLDAVCFGEILWDLFEADPGPPKKAHAGIARTFRRELGGAPANVATALARLGVHTALVGGVGRDRLGNALLADLEADGVDTRFVQRLPKRTGITFVVRDSRGEPDFLFYRHDSADLSLRAEQMKPAMGRARWALLGTSTLMTEALSEATWRFLGLSERAGAKLVVDLNVRPHIWPSRAAMLRAIEALAERADVVKASATDLRALGAAPAAKRPRWLERFAPRATWILTRGPGVAIAEGAHGEVRAPAQRGPCVDATGAGDAFLAGALAVLVAAEAVPGRTAWADPKVWQAALRVGHMMGKKAVSRPGAVAGLVNLGRAKTAIAAVQRRVV